MLIALVSVVLESMTSPLVPVIDIDKEGSPDMTGTFNPIEFKIFWRLSASFALPVIAWVAFFG